MEHRFTVLESRLQGGNIKKVGLDRLRSKLPQPSGICSRPAEPADAVASFDQALDDRTPQDACGASNEDLHALLPFFLPACFLACTLWPSRSATASNTAASDKQRVIPAGASH